MQTKNGHTEVSLQDIWENLEEDTGLNAEEGMRLECETEENSVIQIRICCRYGNVCRNWESA